MLVLGGTMRNLWILLATVALATTAYAQDGPQLGPNAFVGAGGVSSSDAIRHVSATGLGMAVGQQSNDNVRARHGVLGGTSNSEDEVAPNIRDIDDLVVEVNGECVGRAELPAVNVTDNRDRNPNVTVTLRTNPPQDIDPDGEDVDLPLGSYDVVITARDGSGNRSNASYRVDVVDATGPVINPIPNPTPEGEEAEATSPAGTAVRLEFQCNDNCDDSPDAARDPARARYPIGTTEVTVSCTDEHDNVTRAVVSVRIADTQGPRVAGRVPEDIDEECNNRDGAEIDVPQVVWADNGTNAQDLDVSLIVNPGEDDERVFEGDDYPPDTVLLLRGEHVFRYTATDSAGNSAAVNITVNVEDNGVPQIEVIEAPEEGWHNGDGPVTVVLGIADGCGGDGADGLDIQIAPAPASREIDGERVTLTYNQPGVYNLAVQVEDAAGNEASDNSVGFGIDREAPVPTTRVPSQAGVDPDDEDTYLLSALAERLPINFGGEDQGDGVVSGMANVTLVVDPDGADVVVASFDFDGNGNPERGARVAANVGCEADADDELCTDDAELNLRRLGSGPHEILVTATDFAGNSSSTLAYFNALNLTDGLPLIEEQLSAIIGGNPPPAVRGRTIQALQHVRNAQDVTGIAIEDNRYGVPLFLGSTLRFVQNATIALNQAIDAAEGDVQAALESTQHLLLRLARSDVLLLQQTAIDDGAPAGGFLLDAYRVDSGFVDDADEVVGDNLNGEEWNSGAANTLIGVFHAKSMYEVWIDDWNSIPNAFNRDGLLDRYESNVETLTEIRDEITRYLTLDNPPAEDNMTQIRDRLTSVIDRLEVLLEDENGNGLRDGFLGDHEPDAAVGMSDEAYVQALLDLRAVANFSQVAGNQGAWVRNYQWSMMQVVRFMTEASVRSTIAIRGAGRDRWSIHARALELIDEGVEELEDREVQAVIDRYGVERDAICLIIAVYHCGYLDDEGGADEDRAIAENATPDYCWERMWRPSEWGQQPAVDRVPPACQYDPAGGIRDDE